MTELRKRGIITAVICSGPFMLLGKAQARTFGVPDLPLVEIPHPLGGLALDGVKGRADIAVPQLVRLIKEQLK
jgi:hypothetical protein